MDMSDEDKFEMEKRNDNPMNYPTPSMSLDWRFSAANLTNTSMPLLPADNSYAPHNLGFCEMNALSKPNTSMLKGDVFMPNAPGMLPQSLAQFPADSAFIERAARFSCFNGGNFGDMVNPFGIPGPLGLYHPRAGGLLDVFSGSQPQANELNGDISKTVSLSVEHKADEGSPFKNERNSAILLRSHGGSGNDSDEADFSGGQEEPSVLECTGGESSAKGGGSKKRKRHEQDTVHLQAKSPQQTGQTAEDNTEQLPTSTTKNGGKNSKQGSQSSDQPKEDYIHVRARRGQATNSHSLAERVRREKISERMKFLQDLVPGCSKVTGKAVMLDEIINYVQSLQRQVEFLSMKLATVNPRLDFNIEGLLEKSILQSRAGPSVTSMATSADFSMPYHPLHPSQHGLIQTALAGLGNPSDLFRCQLMPTNEGSKETSQVPGVWDDELHNVVQMTYGSTETPDENGIAILFPLKLVSLSVILLAFC
ncbi:hypothetical protein ACFE04_029854 [Oxalis oulophora]